MKLLIVFIALSSAPAFSHEGHAQNCTQIKNEIDRKYCMDKSLEGLKTKLSTEKKTWAKGLSGDSKEALIENLEWEIEGRKSFQSFVGSEISMFEKHLADLNAVAVTAPAKKKKKKKEKKKNPFGIKL